MAEEKKSKPFVQKEFDTLKSTKERRDYLVDRAFRQTGATVFGRGISEENLPAYAQEGTVFVVESGSHAEHWSQLKSAY